MKTNRSFWKKGVMVVALLLYCGVLFADDPPQPPVVNPNPVSQTPPPITIGHVG
ncbi:hypothetical protein [Microbacter margulisiae]|uniref:Uncharacterized protein n=1 Tax=Microbacter margulisiae TaxID=1350067 RepID=A0A7W5DTA3_9PORP|nr:hypothetical protein [Microbacter margulisiae]MBB3188355.1 hypothetical protein [Microbacter margulisiae]